MRSLILLLVILCVAYGDYRLIQFNETAAFWMTEEEVEKIINTVPVVHFMDITDSIDPVQNLKVFSLPVRPTRQSVVNPLIAQVNEDTIFANIGRLSSFTTRYYTSQTGVQAVLAWQAQYTNYILNGRDDIQANLFPHSAWIQPSLIARIPGSTREKEVVIIGGHIDSTSNGATAPGADDDASGSACVLEAFRILASETAAFTPERTIEFHAYAAEEAGLRGSQAIAQQYASQGINVVAMLQLDMTGFVRPGTTRTMGVVTDFTNPAFTAFIRLCISEYITGLTWTNTACGYACSDHASWFRSSYVSGFVFESIFSNSSPYIHTPNDTPSTITKSHAADFAKLAIAIAVELSYAEDK